MKLSEILKNSDYKNCINEKDVDINNFCYDSRKAMEGSLFFALKGKTVDGHRYINNAYEKGARAFVIEGEAQFEEDATYIVVENSRKALSEMSSVFFGRPSKEMKVIGITGTKGKTTIANYIYTLLNNNDMKTGIIGTNGVFYGDVAEETVNTTPESYELQRILADMLKKGMDYVVMEASSQGLMLNRVDDVDFDLGIFTNIHHDHIGPKEHETFEDYVDAKKNLLYLCDKVIVNIDEPRLVEIVKGYEEKVIRISMKSECEYYARNVIFSNNMRNLTTTFDMNGESYILPSIGSFNVYNAIQAVAALEFLGVERESIPKLFSSLKVKGRMEVIPLHGRVFVLDYAHNRFSLEMTLKTLLEYKKNRIITVFGSVGGRSNKRREELAEVSERLSDFSVITTDNPDFEDPKSICDEIHSHFKDSEKAIVVPDRKSAIAKAFELSEPDDIILVAGKGHEDYQIIEGKKVHYSDRESIEDIK